MKYIAYWELNPEISIDKVAEVAKTLSEAATRTKGKVLGWYVTPSVPMWGIQIIEYESDVTPEHILARLTAWLKTSPGIFKTYKVAPCINVMDAIKIALEK